MESTTSEAPSESPNGKVESPASRTASIGILTYRRPIALERALASVLAALDGPLPAPWSVIEVLVIDNDPHGGARSVVEAVAGDTTGGPALQYLHEAAPGVANARNRALGEANGDVLVFIDDDEIPGDGWPGGLLTVLDETGAAMVGGPVLSEFTSEPPAWITDGRFFDRDDPPHRSAQTWLRSGNLAVDLHQIRRESLRFDPRYPQGEDSAFTRKARAAGLDLRWSSRGAITEFVESDRFSVGWRVRREYRSQRAWTRSSLDLASGMPGRITVRARVVAVAAVRAAQGIGRVVGGLASADKARWIDGLATFVGAVGRVVEIAAYRRR